MLKDKKIRIQKPVKVGTGSFATTKWVDLGNSADTDQPKYLWAYYRHMSETETTAALATVAIAEVLFAVNWLPDITTAMRIVYKDITYQIVRIDDFEGRKEDLKIYAKLATVS
ncbi:MAG: phage head closure protein [Bacillota bacterium]|nr:phage head closure protein [Bacillota bacterium]